ncbi:glycosyltransferase family 4 protein [Jannaschia seohaensis]|uniref:Glycosyltransferase involved in cell wall biosynthesis n=1 Tax=Jannaschia seohaensis TaxID=475081 RepID=A0A2Y9AYL3_9RHOB|nr:glycosyltransferase family 4 protein [Jannaschia seohaensis]PWJ17548.1 glycosyltransferase involved in cell wall biosynthesis [Jannaschia seohaensis]SSA47697.1 Glycosyltransferase involved in cell wall bisynthesis [Jannaschia seohaensis]
MKVLNVCETAHGGVGIYQKVISRLEADGHEMHHLLPAQHADFVGSGLRRHLFDRPGRGATAVRNMVRAMRQLVHRLDPDIVFFHSTFALAGLAALRLGGDRRPAIYCPHSWAISTVRTNGLKARLVRAVEGRLAGLADCVVCVSEHERALAERLGYRGRFVVLENAVLPPAPDADGALFSDAPDALHLLFVGRLDPQKGFDILFEALRRADRPDLNLYLVGGSVRGDGVTGPLPHGVHKIGWVAGDQIDSWYKSADAVIVPSRWEGLPLVIPEAFRNGTPVLCSDRSGMDALVRSGETGAVFPLDAEILAELLRGLDKQELRRMRPASRAAYEARFSADRLCRGLDDLFRELADPDRRPAAESGRARARRERGGASHLASAARLESHDPSQIAGSRDS